MYDAPSWLGSAIKAKLNERSNLAVREMANQNALDVAKINSQIAADNRMSQQYIAELNATNNANIADANRLSQEMIAAANRANALEVARIQAGTSVLNTTMRTLPLIAPLAISGQSTINDDSGKNNKNNTNGTASSAKATSVKESAADLQKRKAREKAEGLFPELEPTWSTNVGVLPALDKSVTQRKVTLFNDSHSNVTSAIRGLPVLGGAIQALGTILTFVPFI